jgi:DNA recombination protein RmuC
MQARQQSVAELGAKHEVIDTRLDQVRVEMRTELEKLSGMVASLAEQSAQRFGQVDQSLRSHAEVTHALTQSAQALREAMASPTARGQWGERMAEDVLRLAGFVENVNYVKQTQLEGASGRPDFTFPLPKGHELYMDVKFPMAGYLRYLDATTDGERHAQRAAFLRDVRARVRELARRDYARQSARQSVDYVLMFLPNEQLTGFIHESDPSLIDEAMGQRVVMCSPLTLFAFLGVIRQAYDNFVVEQTSDQILALIGKFGVQWVKYNEQLGKVHAKFTQLDRQFDELMGPRRRQLEKPLQQLDAVRRERNLAIDGQLFTELPELAGAVDGDDGDDDLTPDNIRRLGA